MYIESLKLTNVRTFVNNELHFVHPDQRFRSPRKAADRLLPKPQLPNVNMLLGDNGSGKTTVLQAIALASLGPAARDSQLPLRKFVRFSSSSEKGSVNGRPEAGISASLRLHAQDHSARSQAKSTLRFEARRELERVEFGDISPSHGKQGVHYQETHENESL